MYYLYAQVYVVCYIHRMTLRNPDLHIVLSRKLGLSVLYRYMYRVVGSCSESGLQVTGPSLQPADFCQCYACCLKYDCLTVVTVDLKSVRITVGVVGGVFPSLRFGSAEYLYAWFKVRAWEDSGI